MRLKRDTLGTWPNAQDSIQGDLTTTQRALDDLQGQLTAALARIVSLEGKTAAPGVVIAANGRVTTSLQRNGQPASGFGTGLVVAPNSGLAGQGIITDPLRANPDNTSITIDSNGQLAGIIKKVTIPVAAVSANFFGRATTPLTLVAAVAGVTHVPIYCALYCKVTGNGGNYTNGGTGWNVHYINSFGTLQWLTLTNLALQTNVINPAINRGFSSAVSPLATNNVANATFTAVGKPLLLISGADISGGTNGVMGASCLYYDIADNVY